MNLKEPHVILGVDPGTSLMGYALVRIVPGPKSSPELLTMGIIRLSRFDNHYLRLRRIHERITALCRQYSPTDLAIEAPFFGKNVQSMLKLGRAQGVAIAAALAADIPVAEYEPRRIKLAITGTGSASKEQVREILRRVLSIPDESLASLELDATDALAAALCHFYTISSSLASVSAPAKPSRSSSSSSSSSWKNFISQNPDRVI